MMKTENLPSYFSFKYRILVSFVASSYIVIFNQRKSTFELVYQKNFWIAIIFSFVITSLLLRYIQSTTLALDRYLDWRRKFGKRIIWQLILCVLVPLLLDILVVWAYFEYYENDFWSSAFLRTEFQAIILLVFLINLLLLVWYLCTTDPTLAIDIDFSCVADPTASVMELVSSTETFEAPATESANTTLSHLAPVFDIVNTIESPEAAAIELIKTTVSDVASISDKVDTTKSPEAPAADPANPTEFTESPVISSDTLESPLALNMELSNTTESPIPDIEPIKYRCSIEAQIANRRYRLNLADVVYFQRDHNYGYVGDRDGNKYNIDYKMRDLIQLLDPGKFCQINRSTIVALDAILAVDEIKNLCKLRYPVNDGLPLNITSGMLGNFWRRWDYFCRTA